MNSKWARQRWLDFRLGHSTYLVFAMAFTNFVLISHRLLIERVPILDAILGELWLFAVLFVVAYVPIAILSGVWHRRTQVPVEADTMLMYSPLEIQLFRTILEMQRGTADADEVDALISKISDMEKLQHD